jgi:hypothetical protein
MSCLAFGLLGPVRARAAPVEKLASQAYVVKESQLRTEPYDWAEAIAVLEAGLRVSVVLHSTNKKWVRVQSPSGREGWLPVANTTLGGRRSDVLVSNRGRGGDSARRPASAAEGTGAPLTELGPSDANLEGASASANAEVTDPAVDSTELPPASASSSPDAADASDARAEPTPPTNPAPSRGRLDRRARSKRPRDTEFLGPDARPYQLSLGLGYDHFVNRESMPGAELGGLFLFRLSREFLAGGGMALDFHGTSVSDPSAAVMAKVSRSAFNVVPRAGLRFMHDIFAVDLTIGLDLQRSSLTTTDLDTGLPLATNPAGEKVTGSGWSTGLRVGLAPAVFFPLNDTSLLGFSVAYSLRKEFGSGVGTFAGTPTSSVQHSIGGGLQYLMEF